MPKGGKSLKSKTKISKPRLAVFLAIFALIGVAMLFISLAAPNPNLPGDLDGSNKVDASDLSILLSNYASTSQTSIAAADINGDGHVDVADLSILLSHYGQSVSAFTTNITQNQTITTPFTWTFNPGVTTTNDGFKIAILDTPISGTVLNFNYLVIQ